MAVNQCDYSRKDECDDADKDGWVMVLFPFQYLIERENQLTVSLKIPLQLGQVSVLLLNEQKKYYYKEICLKKRDDLHLLSCPIETKLLC